jgi:chromosome segregation ATPase
MVMSRLDRLVSRLDQLAGEVKTLRRVTREHDRRYSEVNVEREKALKIKETADLAALQLAREIQTYKDEKANELRSQIERERGTYATQSDLRASTEKLEAMIKPLVEYVAAAQGRTSGLSSGWGVLVGVLGLAIAVAVAVLR